MLYLDYSGYLLSFEYMLNVIFLNASYFYHSRVYLSCEDEENLTSFYVCREWTMTCLSTLWTEKIPQNVSLIYSLQNLTDCDKIWYILSWVNLRYRNVNVFRLTWIVPLPYLVKLSIHIFASEQQLELNRKKHTKCFCHIFTKPDWFW